MNEERWVLLPSDRRYAISDRGRIRREVPGPTRARAGRVLKVLPGPRGFAVAKLALRTIVLHRQVWEAFNGPVPSGYYLVHLDGDRGNPALFNLALRRGYGARRQLEDGEAEDIYLARQGGASWCSLAQWHRLSPARLQRIVSERSA